MSFTSFLPRLKRKTLIQVVVNHNLSVDSKLAADTTLHAVTHSVTEHENFILTPQVTDRRLATSI